MSGTFSRPYCLALAVITGIALAARLYGITAIGVGGNDTIYYYSLAEQWLQGNYVFRIGDSVQVFRLVVLGINALALKVIGHTDYALRLANVLLDGANLLLLSLLAWWISRQRLVVIASAISYALLPIAIWSSRQELPHTASTFFVLATCLLIVRALANEDGKTARPTLLLAGVCSVVTALTHEELILLALPIAVFLFFAQPARGVRPGFLERLAPVVTYISVPLLAVVVVFFGQFASVQSVLGSVEWPLGDGFTLWLVKFARFGWDGIVGTTSASMALALALCLIYLAWRMRPNASDANTRFNRWAGFCLLLPIAHIAVYAIFFDTLFSRGFFPLIPLFIVALFYCLASVTARYPPSRFTLLTVLVVVLLIFSNLASYSAFNVGNRRFSASWAEPTWPQPDTLKEGVREFLFDARYARGYGTHWRRLYQVLRGKVDVKHKLLLLPSTTMYSPGRRALQLQVYLGDNVIYRLDHADQTLQQIVSEYDVEWVVFTLAQRRAVPTHFGPYRYNGKWAASGPIDLAHSYGMEVYSARSELTSLLQYLKSAGAVEVYPFPSDSFEYRVARVWRLP